MKNHSEIKSVKSWFSMVTSGLHSCSMGVKHKKSTSDMQQKLTKNTMRALKLLVLGVIFNLPVLATTGDSLNLGCTQTGLVLDVRSTDACEFVILLEDGTLLEPVELAYHFEFADSMHILFGYEELDIVTNCMMGKPVLITCIYEISDSTDCWASFEYEQVDCDSSYSDHCNEIWYTFYGIAPDNTIRWSWYLNDELFSTEQNARLKFTDSGEYRICLEIVTHNGCVAEYCEIIKVELHEECEAAFEYYPVYFDSLYTNEGPVPDTNHTNFTYQFVDYSIGEITYWYWDFGDGDGSLEQHPIHTFPGPGYYEVCLTISSELDNCNDTYCAKVYIDSVGNCEAYFEYCSYSLPVDTTQYNFSAWEDSIPENHDLLIGFKNLSQPNAVSYMWDFGDGGYSYEKNPVHAYEEPGIYAVCLYIYAFNNCYDFYCTDIRVGLPDCKVDFTYEIAVPDCEGFNVAHVFKPEYESEPFYVTWSFGDGEYSYEEYPIHIFAEYGTYETCVEVAYSNGCTAAMCHTIVTHEDSTHAAFMKNCGVSPVIETKETSPISVSNVYPLPATTNLSFEVKSEYQQGINIELTDLLGKKYELLNEYELVEGDNKVEIELNGIKNGIYIYTIKAKEKTLQGQITIIN